MHEYMDACVDAPEEQENRAKKIFPYLEQTPEEYAAKKAHLWESFPYGDYTYLDKKLNDWIHTIDDILFIPGRLEEARRNCLTDDEHNKLINTLNRFSLQKELKKKQAYKLASRLLEMNAIYQEKNIILRVQLQYMTIDEWGIKCTVRVVPTKGLTERHKLWEFSGAWEALSVDDTSISINYSGWSLYSDASLVEEIVTYCQKNEAQPIETQLLIDKIIQSQRTAF